MQEARVHADARQAVVEIPGVAFVEETLPADIKLDVGIQHIADGRGFAMYAKARRTEPPVGIAFAKAGIDTKAVARP